MIQENLYTENSIRTFTGKYFGLKILDPETICIEDIAHALSHVNRFAGHLPKPYSVAQHSYYASLKASKENKLAALLHDASEAYLGDMPSPFKRMLPDYKFQENRVMEAISKKFGFQYPFHPEIKEIDKGLLQIEFDTFVLKKESSIVSSINYMSAAEAEKQFLRQFAIIYHFNT